MRGSVQQYGNTASLLLRRLLHRNWGYVQSALTSTQNHKPHSSSNVLPVSQTPTRPQFDLSILDIPIVLHTDALTVTTPRPFLSVFWPSYTEPVPALILKRVKITNGAEIILIGNFDREKVFHRTISLRWLFVIGLVIYTQPAWLIK